MPLLLLAVSSSMMPGDFRPETKGPAEKAAGVFKFAHAHRQGKGVTVMWASDANPTNVECFAVIRTYEDPNDPYAEWQVVGGSPCNSSHNYKATEQNVSPGFISYRVIASMTNGGTEMSEILTVHKVQH
jgi:hypothetical protein